MRIDVRLPSAGPSASSSNGSSSSKDAITSPPIAKLSPSGELVLIELQGALELEGLDAANPQTIGMLTFEGPKQDKPVLLISHHRLYGKFVDLHQPLAILQKHQREPPASLDSSPSAKRRWLEQPWTSDVESDGEGEGTLEGEEEEGERKKRVKRDDGEDERESGPPSSSPCRPSSVQKKKIDRKASEGGEEDKDDDLVAEWDDDEDDGDENDGGEDSKKDGENAGGKRKRSQGGRKPRVWYDVVSVIRRKILFSQRPEPVVNLGPEHSLAVSSVTTSSSSSLLAS